MGVAAAAGLALLSSSAIAAAGTVTETERADPRRADPPSRFVPGEVLVRYEAGTGAAERAGARARADATLEQRLPIARLELLDLEPGQSVKEAIAALEGRAAVEYAEPNFIYTPTLLPDDEFFPLLWGLHSTGQPVPVDGPGGLVDADIDAPEAWDVNTGSEDVVVAVVDTGVSLTHEDLNGNLWTNPDEEAGAPTVDDDANGFDDDVNGWNFVDENADPSDDDGHGTHVAGTVAAEGNNTMMGVTPGVAGVNWDASLMALRVCSLDACTNADVSAAFEYAGDNGADIANVSLGGGGFSFAMADAIAGASETLFVVAAGNDSSNNDTSADYPCSYPSPNLICVAASDRNDSLAGFSNFGQASVDLAAPGVDVGSTYPLDDVFVQSLFTTGLGAGWTTDGTPDSWRGTSEPTNLTNTTLTDSHGADYDNNTDNHATRELPDLTGRTGCHLRYRLQAELADADDMLLVQVSTDDFATETTVDPIPGPVNIAEETRRVQIPTLDGAADPLVRFKLVTDIDGVADGVHIDDIEIRCLDNSLYVYLSGTSMATPHVAGAAALLKAEDTDATTAQLREWLLDGVDLKPALAGLVASGGRLNLARSIAGAEGADIHRPETAITSGPTTAGTRGPAVFGLTADEPGSFRCRIDSGAWTSCSSPSIHKRLSRRLHTFSAYAVDLAGNEDVTPVSRSFRIAVTARCKTLRRKLRRARIRHRTLRRQSTLRRVRVLKRKTRRACRTF